MKVKVSETERTVGEHVTLLRDREVIICDVDYYASLFLLFIFYFFRRNHYSFQPGSMCSGGGKFYCVTKELSWAVNFKVTLSVLCESCCCIPTTFL
jgi:hypothetical protein